MSTDQLKDSRETGRKVWESLQCQVAEGNGFLSAMFKSMRLFVRRYFLSFLLIGVAAAALSAGYWLLQPRIYEGEMTVSYVHYEKKIYADMLAKLDHLIKAGSFTSLSFLLNVPEETARSLRSIAGYNIRNEALTEDLSTEKIPFYIRVKVSDVDALVSLQPALVDYLNGTKFIQDRLAYMHKKSNEDLIFLKRRLAVVDSLSGMLIIRKEGISDEKAITRMELLQEALILHDRIQQVKGSLEFNLNIEVLDGFVPSDKPTGPTLIHFIIYGFLAGMVLRLFAMIFI